MQTVHLMADMQPHDMCIHGQLCASGTDRKVQAGTWV